MTDTAFDKIRDGLVDAIDAASIHSALRAAEAKISEARRILLAVTDDDGAMLSPIALSDAVCKVLDIIGRDGA